MTAEANQLLGLLYPREMMINISGRYYGRKNSSLNRIELASFLLSQPSKLLLPLQSDLKFAQTRLDNMINLRVPDSLRASLKADGLDPDSPIVVYGLYGMPDKREVRQRVQRLRIERLSRLIDLINAGL